MIRITVSVTTIPTSVMARTARGILTGIVLPIGGSILSSTGTIIPTGTTTPGDHPHDE